jgi:hypothetical protein
MPMTFPYLVYCIYSAMRYVDLSMANHCSILRQVPDFGRKILPVYYTFGR